MQNSKQAALTKQKFYKGCIASLSTFICMQIFPQNLSAKVQTILTCLHSHIAMDHPPPQCIVGSILGINTVRLWIASPLLSPHSFKQSFLLVIFLWIKPELGQNTCPQLCSWIEGYFTCILRDLLCICTVITLGRKWKQLMSSLLHYKLKITIPS